ncbi:MAG: flavodoxin family protein [Oscillospiraceae bacterium]|nr:flavodoxin family protein [Oscillospiraceae bacterium]
MKVILINGSPHAKGCTYTALCEVAASLEKNGVETEIFQIGKGAVRGCIACGGCAKAGKCIFDDDVCNAMAAKIAEADGIVVGSPVYYASANGALCALLDRAFFSQGHSFAHKPAAAVVSCRRGGASAAFDRLNKYFTINQMPVVSSTYWNSVHGFTAEDVKKDLEGLQVMRQIGENMAYLLRCSRDSGLPLPPEEEKIATNFMDGK